MYVKFSWEMASSNPLGYPQTTSSLSKMKRLVVIACRSKNKGIHGRCYGITNKIFFFRSHLADLKNLYTDFFWEFNWNGVPSLLVIVLWEDHQTYFIFMQCDSRSGLHCEPKQEPSFGIWSCNSSTKEEAPAVSLIFCPLKLVNTASYPWPPSVREICDVNDRSSAIDAYAADPGASPSRVIYMIKHSEGPSSYILVLIARLSFCTKLHVRS